MFSLPESEFKGRVERLQDLLAEKKLDAAYLSGGTTFNYFTGYGYLATERPAALVVKSDGSMSFMGPVIERDHIRDQTRMVGEIFSYLDYPGDEHPMKRFAGWLREMQLGGKSIGVESKSFYSSPWGYTGIDLGELMPDTKFVPIGPDIYKMRKVKSDNEITLVRESVKWGDVAHRLLQAKTRAGVYDWEISAEASLEASREMKKTLGSSYKATLWGMVPAHAGFRGQVGVHSVYPHSISIERQIMKGDVLGTGASADVGGYHTELERNMFVGEVDGQARRYHSLMLKMQDAAFQAMKPGGRCSDADKASYGVAKENGVEGLVLHHTGHGMGLEGHEAPFLDMGDDTVLEAGMVMSLEPGLYVPGLGGFRHSDTVVVGKDSVEWLTTYPRDFESLTVAG